MILLSGFTLSTGQIQSADSNHVLVDKLELKYIITVFNDFNALKEINNQQVLKNGILERIIGDKDKIIMAKEEDNQLLQQAVKDVSPAWWNKFITGFVSGVLIIVTIFLAIK